MSVIISDFGICRTLAGAWWLAKNGEMFKQYDDYESIVMALQTEDLDKLWDEYQQKKLFMGVNI